MKKYYIIAAYLITMFLGFPIEIFAQEKPSCSPKSCGPENTKTAEAKVITNMRNDLQTAIGALDKTDVDLSEQLTNRQIAKGSSDDESLLIIYQTVISVRSELTSKIESEKILPALKEPLMPTSNKQQLVANLKTEIKLLAEQASQL